MRLLHRRRKEERTRRRKRKNSQEEGEGKERKEERECGWLHKGRKIKILGERRKEVCLDGWSKKDE